jgi:hypothetical protein
MFGLNWVLKLKPCTFKYDAPLNDGKTHLGFIAQEIEEIAPQEEYGIVHMKHLPAWSRNEYRAVNYNELIAPMVKAIQELNGQVNELKNKVRAMEFKEVFEVNEVPEMKEGPHVPAPPPTRKINH